MAYNKYTHDLIKTLDKRLTLQMLRDWRVESESKVEADLLGEVIDAIESGDLDG